VQEISLFICYSMRSVPKEQQPRPDLPLRRLHMGKASREYYFAPSEATPMPAVNTIIVYCTPYYAFK
jgi:hypothetical protein